MTKSVNCPTCMKLVPWTVDNQHRPFCSERCKLIDLGDWASGKHAIPGESVSSHDDEQSSPDNEDFLRY